jgi:ABC-type multidrug transport system ATPase subunit
MTSPMEHRSPEKPAASGGGRGVPFDSSPAGTGIPLDTSADRRGEVTLSFEEVTKRYGRHRAVDRLSLEVQAGELLALVGPNGSGKSTLLRLAAGLLLPTTGHILVAGAEAGSPAAAERLRYVPDRAIGLPELSARTNLRLFARRPIAPSDADAVMKAVRLSKVARRPLKTFSLGMRQRLMLGALILADDPPGLPPPTDRQPVGVTESPLPALDGPTEVRGTLFLLDEPTSALDPDGREWLWGVLHRRVAHGGAVVVATHDLADAVAHATTVLRVRDGRLDTSEPPPPRRN